MSAAANGWCVERVVTGDNMKRFLAGLLILVGVVAVVAVISMAGRDIPSPDVGDLMVERMELPVEENAFTHFMSAADVHYWPTNSTVVTDYLEGKPVEADAFLNIHAGRNARYRLRG